MLDHFQNPRNPGLLEARDAGVLLVDAENPACGDRLCLSARIQDGLVAEARFQVRGCTAAIACGSALTVWLQGREVAPLARLSPADLAQAVVQDIEQEVGGLGDASSHAAALCAEAVRLLCLRLGE
ncbi:MAG: iron-sulfur cluster assembly scaffold protein [Candidatus Solibacter usitatus]|nr:iron-sulfur cluster assembly scaffold protein [Candidatus Solibacter usitatus]